MSWKEREAIWAEKKLATSSDMAVRFLSSWEIESSKRNQLVKQSEETGGWAAYSWAACGWAACGWAACGMCGWAASWAFLRGMAET